MTKQQNQTLMDEFQDFKPPQFFAGGCRKSERLTGFCAHFRPDGSVGKFEENCKTYSLCTEGYCYKFNP